MDKIILKGMEFYAYHGVMKEEQRLGQRFIVDITMILSLQEAGETEVLSKTVNYAEVYELCKSIVMTSSVQLIERLAWLINKDVMHRYPQIVQVITTVHKPSAPVGGLFNDVSVTLEKVR